MYSFVSGSDEDGVAIEVKILRETVAGENFIAKTEVVLDGFSWDKEAVESFSCGVI